MRWIMLILTLTFGGLAYLTDSPGVMGFALLAMVVCGFFGVLAFAQARIDATSQSQATVLSSKDVQMLRQQSLQKKVANSRAHQQGTVGDGVSE